MIDTSNCELVGREIYVILIPDLFTVAMFSRLEPRLRRLFDNSTGHLGFNLSVFERLDLQLPLVIRVLVQVLLVFELHALLAIRISIFAHCELALSMAILLLVTKLIAKDSLFSHVLNEICLHAGNLNKKAGREIPSYEPSN